MLLRYIDKIYPAKKELEKALKSGKRLIIYHGVDPTNPHLHLGHSTNFLLLKKFQKFGHQIILLIGDFTAQIGDPTGKMATRQALTRTQILENCQTYKKQAGKILGFNSKTNPVKLKFNSQWLNKLTPEEIVKLAASVTHGQMIKRSMFQRRLKEKAEIYLHEFLYPLFQGYDSVALNCDIEVGGTDQTFNMLVGRDLLKIYKNKEKFVITTPLLINPKTGQKLMSKSEAGFIALDENPRQMYGKIMALPDEVVLPCFELCTELPLKEINKIKKGLKIKEISPRDAKAKLAGEIVSLYHGKKAALKAQKEFERVFKLKELPSEIPLVRLKEKKLNILDLLVKTKLASSKSEAKRLVLQKGVKIDNRIIENWQEVVGPEKGQVVKVGKRRFVKIG